jgi:hypothetical protein
MFIHIRLMIKMSDGKTQGAIGLSIIFAIAIIILISKALFPFFFILSIILFIGLLLTLVFEVQANQLGEFSIYVGGALIGLVLLTGLTWGIGYGFGETPVGKASVELYVGITGAEQKVSGGMQDAINKLVDESCETLTEENCNLLKFTAKSAQTLKEVSDKANQLKTLGSVVKSVS